MQSSSREVFIAFVLGMPVAVICLFIAGLMTGAGHGWVTPLWFGFASFAAYPAAIWSTLRLKRRPQASGAILVLAGGVFSDVLLYKLTSQEGWEYFNKVAPYNYVWLAIWMSWQILALFALVAAFNRRAS